MKNIIKYREAAITYLKSKAAFLFQDIDNNLDAALRLISKLPLRPFNADTYNNIVGIKPVVEQRIICLELLLQRLNKESIDSIHNADYLIDDSVRILNSLDKRPTGNLPYFALFTLEEPKNNTTKYKNVKDLSVNKEGVQLMHFYEGCVLHAYKDPGSNDGLPITIGFGSTRINNKPIKLGTTITQAQADQYFLNDLIQFEDAIKQLVKVPITENMYSALVAFTYNVGVGALKNSTALKRLNNKDFKGAAESLTWFNKGGNGKVLAGLVKRREAEAELFLKDM